MTTNPKHTALYNTILMFYEYANAFNYKHFKNEEFIFQMTEEKFLFCSLFGCVKDIYNNNLSSEYFVIILLNVNYIKLTLIAVIPI